MNAPLLTAMVSTYASERYLQGCLDDLLAQTLGDRLEIVVVDAASPQREGELVRAYQQHHANIRYVRCTQRENTSAAFDRATALARGRYVTNANTDDRHHPEFAERMVAVLEQCPQFGIAYADSAINHVDNETWQDTTATQHFAWPHYTPAVALSCCLFGPQPVWRKDAHQRAGGWSPTLTIANDQDMFLRIARAHGAVHVDEVLGMFLQRPDSVAGSGERAKVLAEGCAVMRRYRTEFTIDDVVPGATRHGPDGEAAAWFELGNLAALSPYTDAQLALQCYQRALALPLVGDFAAIARIAFANNTACVLACGGALPQAQRALALVPTGPLRAHNERLVAVATPAALPRLQQLRFAELDHPVVEQSRRSRGVTLDRGLRVHWTAERRQLPWDVYVGPNGVPWQRDEAAAPVG